MESDDEGGGDGWDFLGESDGHGAKDAPAEAPQAEEGPADEPGQVPQPAEDAGKTASAEELQAPRTTEEAEEAPAAAEPLAAVDPAVAVASGALAAGGSIDISDGEEEDWEFDAEEADEEAEQAGNDSGLNLAAGGKRGAEFACAFDELPDDAAAPAAAAAAPAAGRSTGARAKFGHPARPVLQARPGAALAREARGAALGAAAFGRPRGMVPPQGYAPMRPPRPAPARPYQRPCGKGGASAAVGKGAGKGAPAQPAWPPAGAAATSQRGGAFSQKGGGGAPAAGRPLTAGKGFGKGAKGRGLPVGGAAHAAAGGKGVGKAGGKAAGGKAVARGMRPPPERGVAVRPQGKGRSGGGAAGALPLPETRRGGRRGAAWGSAGAAAVASGSAGAAWQGEAPKQRSLASSGQKWLGVKRQKEGVDKKTVIVHLPDIMTSYGKVVQKMEHSSPDWEGVRKAVMYLKHDRRWRCVGVIDEGYKAANCNSVQSVAMPKDVRSLLDEVVEVPIQEGQNRSKAVNKATAIAAYERNCRYLHNQNFRNWGVKLEDCVMKWVLRHSNLLHMRYNWDPMEGIGVFNLIGGNQREADLADNVFRTKFELARMSR